MKKYKKPVDLLELFNKQKESEDELKSIKELRHIVEEAREVYYDLLRREERYAHKNPKEIEKIQNEIERLNDRMEYFDNLVSQKRVEIKGIKQEIELAERGIAQPGT